MQILIAEDFDDCATTTAALLRVSGHQVRIVRNGPAVIDACRERLPDVILLDIGLPGLDGYEVATRLHEEFGPATPRLIAMSGLGQPSDLKRSADAGMIAHFVKPVDFDELNSLLSTGRRAVGSGH